jgi:putative ABC transport system permease protein
VEKLFGIPIDLLMIIFLVLLAPCAAVIIFFALQSRAMFKIAARNLPRRPAQTTLVILGLMLAATLFSASFATGDTISYSIRTAVVEGLGEVDIIITSQEEDAYGRSLYFDEGEARAIRDLLEGRSEFEGASPSIIEIVAVDALGEASDDESDRSLREPSVSLLGLDPQWTQEPYARLRDANGEALDSLDSLSTGEVYISTDLAEELEVSTSEGSNQIDMIVSGVPTSQIVAGIYEEGGNPADKLSVVIPLSHLQDILVGIGRIEADQVNAVLITNAGGVVGGAAHSDTLMAILEEPLEERGLEAESIKKEYIDEADQVGSFFTMIFMLFGQFSVMAGILLIFLIFVMLAAERKRELGIMRAVGARWTQVVLMFSFEGVLYAVIAAAVGSVLGIVIGWGMVQVMAQAFGVMDFELIYHVNLQSLVISYVMGVGLTIIVVAVSSLWVSRLNIVRAIRDIPEPKRRGKAWDILLLVLGIVGVVYGLLLVLLGILLESAALYLLGLSLLIIGASLLVRRLGVPDRVAYSLAGALLVALWVTPVDVHSFIAEFSQDLSLFLLSGIFLVTGSVWVVMYNSDALLAITTTILGRIRRLTPILKTAVSYPLASRFRTGMALAMFALIVFTLVVMAVINATISSLYEDTERLSGGFHLSATTTTSPIGNLSAAIDEAEALEAEDFEAIAGLTGELLEVLGENQFGEPDWSELYFQGVDANYTGAVSYGFAMMMDGHESAAEVWQALTDGEDLAVVSSSLVPSRVNYNLSFGEPTYRIGDGEFVLEDEVLPDDVYIDARHPDTLEERRLHVIGVLESAGYGAPVILSRETLDSLLPQPMLPLNYLVRVSSEVEDVSALAKDFESEFFENGMDVEVIAEQIEEISRVNMMINNVMTGFMGLGLIVGICALGVIAARSVVERRQQIGMLRALGFQRTMVQLSFLIEFSFIALLGIGLGVVLGCAIGIQVVDDISGSVDGVRLVIPWVNIGGIVAIAYVAALVTTYLPARQASRVYPAEALRYE